MEGPNNIQLLPESVIGKLITNLQRVLDNIAAEHEVVHMEWTSTLGKLMYLLDQHEALKERYGGVMEALEGLGFTDIPTLIHDDLDPMDFYGLPSVRALFDAAGLAIIEKDSKTERRRDGSIEAGAKTSTVKDKPKRRTSSKRGTVVKTASSVREPRRTMKQRIIELVDHQGYIDPRNDWEKVGASSSNSLRSTLNKMVRDKDLRILSEEKTPGPYTAKRYGHYTDIVREPDLSVTRDDASPLGVVH